MTTKKLPVEASSSDTQKEQLIAGFKAVMSDAEALVKATANQSGEALATLRTNAQASLALAKEHIADAEDELIARAKEAAKATDVYVHQNPWQAAGVAAGIGVLIGFLVGRR